MVGLLRVPEKIHFHHVCDTDPNKASKLNFIHVLMSINPTLTTDMANFTHHCRPNTPVVCSALQRQAVKCCRVLLSWLASDHSLLGRHHWNTDPVCSEHGCYSLAIALPASGHRRAVWSGNCCYQLVEVCRYTMQAISVYFFAEQNE